MRTLDLATVAYVAGVIDLMGVIRTRQLVTEAVVPYVALSGPNIRMLDYLGELTDTKAFKTRRSYYKAGCSQHCKEKHQHIESTSGRWSISGGKATVLLWNIRPYLRLQVEEALAALSAGLTAPVKPATLQKMTGLGWDIPDLPAERKRA